MKITESSVIHEAASALGSAQELMRRAMTSRSFDGIRATAGQNVEGFGEYWGALKDAHHLRTHRHSIGQADAASEKVQHLCLDVAGLLGH